MFPDQDGQHFRFRSKADERHKRYRGNLKGGFHVRSVLNFPNPDFFGRTIFEAIKQYDAGRMMRSSALFLRIRRLSQPVFDYCSRVDRREKTLKNAWRRSNARRRRGEEAAEMHKNEEMCQHIKDTKDDYDDYERRLKHDAQENEMREEGQQSGEAKRKREISEDQAWESERPRKKARIVRDGGE